MATNTTIKTQIVVQFDDQFSDAANRANEKYFKSFEEAHKKAQEIRANFKPFYEDSFEDIRKALVPKSIDSFDSNLRHRSTIVLCNSCSKSEYLSNVCISTLSSKNTEVLYFKIRLSLLKENLEALDCTSFI